MNRQFGYSSVKKSIWILTSFIHDNKEMSVQELSNKLGRHYSTVSRLLQILIHYRLIRFVPNIKKYLPGGTSGQLGQNSIN